MLPSIKSAVSIKGRRNVAIARDIDRKDDTVTAWFSGRLAIPLRMRQALDEAVGAPIDWEAYGREYAEEHDRRYNAKAEAAPRPVAAPAPPVAPAPLKIAATAPRRLVAAPITPKAAPRPQAAPTASAPKPGFLSRFLASDAGDLFA